MNDLTRMRFEELKAGGSLPSPKGVALTLLEVTAREDANVHDVTRLVQLDPAMAGRVLRYANNAHDGNRRHIVSLTPAVTFLGLFRVRQIVLGFSLIDQFHEGKCAAFDYTRYWSSSLASGIAAQKLASVAQCPSDESFSCGLLAGIGRLGFATVFPDQYATLLGRELSGDALLQAETAQFGINHAELAAEMLCSWGIPQIFSDAVRSHEEPAALDFPPGSRTASLCAALHFATRIGDLLSLDDTQRWQHIPSLFNAAARLGMSEEAVPVLIEEVVADWQTWAKELNLPTQAYSDVRTLLASPPCASHDGPGHTLNLTQLHVGVYCPDDARAKRLEKALDAAGISPVRLFNLATAADGHEGTAFDVLVVDVDAPEGITQLRQAIGGGTYLMVYIPNAIEAGATAMIEAGAADYLLHDFTQSALLARLAAARRLLSLQNAVRAERRLSVSACVDWGRANQRLLAEALTDSLTRLPNRRYGMDRFAQEWSVASSNRLPIACLMLDIDHFKQINDRHGHPVGDIVLQQMATVIERCSRRTDILFRFGGEEFCFICPSTSATEGMQLGRRIVAEVRAGQFGSAASTFPVTISIGLAIRTATMREPQELLDEADRALYAAKKGGRNRVVHRSDSG